MKHIAPSILVASILLSCGGNSTDKTHEQRITEDVDTATGIITLRDYELSDTITVHGKQYRYTYALNHVDTMSLVLNPQGLEYKESRVRVKVETDNEVVFDKTYYKNDLAAFVPKDELPSYTMVGVNYNHDKRNEDRTALYFIVTVGDPDETSDIAYPVELRVNTDGTSSLGKARNLETESLNPNLNIDPSAEGGV